MKTEAIKLAINRIDDSDKFNYGIKAAAFNELAALEAENTAKDKEIKRLKAAVGAALLPGGLRNALGIMNGRMKFFEKEE